MKIATHNRTMHADEVTAIALLKVFTDNNISIDRVEHNTVDFSGYDIVIDISKKFDGIKYFDHHQYEGGKSSAGLIWDYIGLNKQYPKISRFIDAIDQHDVGIKKAKEFEYSNLIKVFNNLSLSQEEQFIQFEKAVDFAITVIESMKDIQDEVKKAKSIVNNSYNFNSNPKVIELDMFTPHWGVYINGILTPNINAVVWEDPIDNTWKIKIPPKRLGSYDLNGKKLKQCHTMNFVHSAGHFAIAKDEKTMQQFVKNQIK